MTIRMMSQTRIPDAVRSDHVLAQAWTDPDNRIQAAILDGDARFRPATRKVEVVARKKNQGKNGDDR